MKFICLGYMNETAWDSMTPPEREAWVEECFAYDDELRAGGHFVGGEALQSVRNGVTLRYQNGQVKVTDGPFAETKEQLGGILILEARDLNHAIALMSLHPGVRAGSFEIRPSEEGINQLMAERSRRLQSQSAARQ